VRTLYLSHNALRSLAGLAQFPALQQLALSHNHVAELAQLRHLRPVSSRLHTLSLDGNPVATVPLYREHCLSACPALTLLDGQPVDCAERAAATEALRAEGDLLRAMRADAMTLEQVRAVSPYSLPPCAVSRSIGQQSQVLAPVLRRRGEGLPP